MEFGQKMKLNKKTIIISSIVIVLIAILITVVAIIKIHGFVKSITGANRFAN